ncbi:MAG: serpin family protein [Planctomycetota bacterium]|jgi:serpin B
MRNTIIILILLSVFSICSGGCEEKQHEQVETKKAQKMVVEGNNKFALDLYSKLRSGEGNMFFSPYSISTALAMTYAGSRGQTQQQMAKVLHFPTIPQQESELQLSKEQFHGDFGKIILDMNTRGTEDKYELSVANALWGQKGFEFLNEFLELIKVNYDGGLNEVDFAAALEEARQTINKWVEEKTREKIKDLIKKGMLDSMTRLVLTNAIYFKGNWASQFDEKLTMDAPFHVSASEKTDVPMMNQKGKFGYLESEDLQALELPYVDDELSMIILLPKKDNKVEAIEEKLTEQNLADWIKELKEKEVIVFLPKFKMTSEFMLADVLRSMGMVDAFTMGADFSGMNGKRDLFISAVIHKAYVDVNEEGTEAAAATAVGIRLTAIEEPPPVFRADRPFVFLIRDKVTGSILFLGRVMKPTQ